MISNHLYRKYKSMFMSAVAVTCAILVIFPLVLILGHLLREGFGALNWDFFTKIPKPVGEVGGGMANAIAGTMILLAMALLIGAPIGVLGAIYLSEYGNERVNLWIRFSADILNGVPSIVWGMTAYALLVVPFKSFSAYAGGLALSFIMIPMVLRTTEEVLNLVPGIIPRSGPCAGDRPLEGDRLHRPQFGTEGYYHRDPPRFGTSRRRDRPAPFHRVRKCVLGA